MAYPLIAFALFSSCASDIPMFAMISLRQPGKAPAQGRQQTCTKELPNVAVVLCSNQSDCRCVAGNLRFIGNIETLLHIFLVKVNGMFRDG
ncbi:hypothetical protein [Pantoea vagans]|uniref:hypothetical protein n=1 Tax=Pantoea vagans TaxID=470934 RepID=UPI00366D7D65